MQHYIELSTTAYVPVAEGRKTYIARECDPDDPAFEVGDVLTIAERSEEDFTLTGRDVWRWVGHVETETGYSQGRLSRIRYILSLLQ